MRFANPHFFALFLAFAGLVVFVFWGLTMRKKARERFIQKDLLPDMLIRMIPGRQAFKAVLLVSGVFFCTVALMRPQWGFRWQEVKHKGLDIIIALDTSRSMLAADIKPNRLERAKLAVRDFVRGLGGGDRIGLVSFAGSAFLECPLTVDYGGFLLALDNLDTDAIPRGGTSISSAIKEAVRAFPSGTRKSKVLVIITDGEDHEGDPVAAAGVAKEKDIIIHCIGIGTNEGELIFVEDQAGNKEFLKDRHGNAVKSRLDEGILQKIALTAGGVYIRSTSTEFGLDVLYKERLSEMEKSESEGKMRKRYDERYQLFLAVGLVLLIVEPFIGELKKT